MGTEAMCTVFDARRGRPFMHKLSTDELSVPAAGWIAVGGSAMGPGHADGSCGDARCAARTRAPMSSACASATTACR
jgi:hypothetical protein